MPPKLETIKIHINEDRISANTSKGVVWGLRCRYNNGNDKYYKFTRVRYAQIPDGDLRFASPEDIATFEDLNFGNGGDNKRTTGSKNKKNTKGKNEKQTDIKNKEDCLFLHIYTPELPPNESNKHENEHCTRPVIVFVPPSLYSDQVETFYGGEFLMAEDVVLVVLCHRQDVSGFTGFNEPNDELKIAGDAGFQDIIKGFEFVKKEIRNFGGCPDNITAYGQGLSCAYIRWLTLDPYSGKYFHKMILSSSMEHSIRHISQRRQYDVREVAEKIGYGKKFDDDKARVEYLRKVPVEMLISCSDPMYGVTNRKVVHKANLLEVQKAIYGVHMPVLIGFNAMEGLNDSLHLPEHFNMVNYCGLLLYLADIDSTLTDANARAASVINFYQEHLNRSGGIYKNMCHQMIESDIRYVIGTLHLANNLAQEMNPEKVYLYKFSANLALNSMKNLHGRQSYRGTAHGDELGYIFRNEREKKVEKNSDKGITIKRMTRIWAQFARTGDPNRVNGSAAPWQPIRKKLTHYFEIDSKREAYREFLYPETARFQFWEEIYGMNFLSPPERLCMIFPKEESKGQISAYTSKGRIKGDVCQYKNIDYYSFQHVPYVQVPVGNLRFAAPQDISSFEDVKRSKLDQDGRYGIEDHLFLHIYTPEVRPEASKKYYTRPVIVFVPGRLSPKAEQYRSEDLYGPQFLLQEDVVLVVLSYRRGILGFTAFEKPNAELDVPVDAGVQDIIKAFGFVQKEIRHFGGCSDNVTAYGQGTGATFVRMIAAKYGKSKLFHKMILSSSMEHATGIELPKKCYKVRSLLAKVSAENSADAKTCIEQLRKLPAGKLLNMDSLLQEEQNRIFRVKHLRPLLTTITYKTTMPVLIGYNSMEGLIDPITSNGFHEDLQKVLDLNLDLAMEGQRSRPVPAAIEKANRFYSDLARATGKSKDQLTDILVSDIDYNIGTIALAAHFARAMARENVYLYRFGVDLDCNFTARLHESDPCNEAAHGDELGYIFKTPITKYVREGSLNDKAIKRMTKLWAQFARTGNPNPEKRIRGLLDEVWRPIGKRLTHCFHIDTGSVSDRRIPEVEVQRFKFWENLTDLNFFSGSLGVSSDYGKRKNGPGGSSDFSSNTRRKYGHDDHKGMERRR